MPLDITFTLSDDDLARFQAIVDKARTAVEDDTAAKNIERAARELLRQTRETELPEFISTRMSRLSIVIDMINDEDWKLSEDERRHVLSALAYLCDPEDLIPDHIPGLGFLDDAIMIELVVRELRHEIEAYQDFCDYRDRLSAKGDGSHASREGWLDARRKELQARMRRRRGRGRRILS